MKDTLRERIEAIRIIVAILMKEFPNRDVRDVIDIAARIVEALESN